MRRFILTTLAVVGVTVGLLGSSATVPVAHAAAHNPLIVWQGSVTFTALSAGCAGTAVERIAGAGNVAISEYRPKLDPAEPSTALSMVFPRGASLFIRKTGNAFMKGLGTYDGALINQLAYSFPNPDGTPYIQGNYNLTITPNTITDTTTSNVTITGTVTNFGHNAGCNVSFTGVYSRRPN